MNTTERKLLERCKPWLSGTGNEIAALIKDIEACLAKPVQEPVAAEMTWEDFAKIAYEAAAMLRKDRLISNGRTNEVEHSPLEFYELSHDGRDLWVHGCAVALAAYKKLNP
jgi:hypothetical protein